MAYAQADPGEKIVMPSNDAYWVRIRTRPYQPQRRAAAVAAAKVAMALGADQVAMAVDAEVELILSMILDWNLTDEDEQLLAVSEESVNAHMPGPDIDAVCKRAQAIISEAENVSAPLAKPSDPLPPDTELTDPPTP
jgi:hypothetical protein